MNSSIADNGVFARVIVWISLSYCIYGKKQQAIVPLLCGIGLMAYPYFVSNAILMVLIGVVLSVIPIFYRS
jgi:hypothetical protein